MTTNDWLRFFKKHKHTKIFHINHLKVLTETNEQSLRVSLSRLNRKKITQRISRGFYANPLNQPSLEEVAATIYAPSYISLESALAMHGVLSQIPHVLTCVSTQLPRVFTTPLGTIEYRQIKKTLFWGFTKTNGCCVADPEKAILDHFYLTTKKNWKLKRSLLSFENISTKQLLHYARKMHMEKAISTLITKKHA